MTRKVLTLHETKDHSELVVYRKKAFFKGNGANKGI